MTAGSLLDLRQFFPQPSAALRPAFDMFISVTTDVFPGLTQCRPSRCSGRGSPLWHLQRTCHVGFPSSNRLKALQRTAHVRNVCTGVVSKPSYLPTHLSWMSWGSLSSAWQRGDPEPQPRDSHFDLGAALSSADAGSSAAFAWARDPPEKKSSSSSHVGTETIPVHKHPTPELSEAQLTAPRHVVSLPPSQAVRLPDDAALRSSPLSLGS